MKKQLSLYLLVGLAVTMSYSLAGGITLTGENDRIDLRLPAAWELYGQEPNHPIKAISLTPNAHVYNDAFGTPTASIALEVISPGKCNAATEPLKSRLTAFGQKLQADADEVRIGKRRVRIFHTKSYMADYYYACFSLRKDCVLASLTVAAGSSGKFTPRFKRDWLWTLQHLLVQPRANSSME